MSKLSIDLAFFKSKEWEEKRTFSRAEALLDAMATIELDGKYCIRTRHISDKFGWGMSRSEKFAQYLISKYPLSGDKKWIIQVTEESTIINSPVVEVPTLFGTMEVKKPEASWEERFAYFIKRFNEIKGGSKAKASDHKMTDKAKGLLRSRIKEGYNSSVIFKALSRAVKDKYHLENGLKFITASYILRADVLDRFINAVDEPNVAKKVELTNFEKRQVGLLPKK
ncbi:hypothetical protein [Sphingobacterium sp. ML3W]|uniref:hypothetical protein n=1 Tax=Sphingobacterium sp. ML3W TaxID=1538644 RepID=UPI0005704AA3|nr:hypothetical protein [Sphingobacterium sp. ML3W]